MAEYKFDTHRSIALYFGLAINSRNKPGSIRYDSTSIAKLHSIEFERGRRITYISEATGDGRINYSSPSDNTHLAWINNEWIEVSTRKSPWIGSLTSEDIPPPPSQSATPTNTPTVTPSITISNSITPSVTLSPTPTITESLTPTPTISVTSTPTPTTSVTITPTPNPSASLTATPTPTPNPSPSVTASVTPTPSITESLTPTPSITASLTPTPTITKSLTPTLTITQSITQTQTVTPTASITKSVTPTSTVTSTQTPTPTVTKTVTATPTITPTVTRTQTPSATHSPTPTPSETSCPDPSPTPTPSYGTIYNDCLVHASISGLINSNRYESFIASNDYYSKSSIVPNKISFIAKNDGIQDLSFLLTRLEASDKATISIRTVNLDTGYEDSTIVIVQNNNCGCSTIDCPTVSPTPSPSPGAITTVNYNGCIRCDDTDFIPRITTVGTNGKASYYGTYDQNGNVWEWIEGGTTHTQKYLRGGSFNSSAAEIDGSSALSRKLSPANATSAEYGFRVASYSNPLNYRCFVTIENTCNTPDPNGTGRAKYVYQIHKYPVTNYEYVGFLNSVAFDKSSDYKNLYNVQMEANASGGIIRRFNPAKNRYEYSLKENMSHKPVNFVTWLSAARYCNWLHNRFGDTENGSYRINQSNITRNQNATYFLPSDNEWYKAAYYHGDDKKYYRYATQSNRQPLCPKIDIAGTGPFVRDDQCDCPQIEICEIEATDKLRDGGQVFRLNMLKNPECCCSVEYIIRPDPIIELAINSKSTTWTDTAIDINVNTNLSFAASGLIYYDISRSHLLASGPEGISSSENTTTYSFDRHRRVATYFNLPINYKNNPGSVRYDAASIAKLHEIEATRGRRIISISQKDKDNRTNYDSPSNNGHLAWINNEWILVTATEGKWIGSIESIETTDTYAHCRLQEAQNLPSVALIGKIGENGSPFLIGKNKQLIANTTGRLYLAINDTHCAGENNSGYYYVTIQRDIDDVQWSQLDPSLVDCNNPPYYLVQQTCSNIIP